jgi:hypothetical protein
MTITYNDFITKYPPYGLAPYDQITVEDRLAEIINLFPQIDSCLPEETRLQATYYAFRDLELQEDCDTVLGVESITSLNDKVVFSKGKTPYSLNTTMWGNRLGRLFRTYGCHVSAAPSSRKECC